MGQVEWYYARDNRQMGPVSSVELKRLATFDELRPDDLVWREGMTEWAAARNVRGLFDHDGGSAAAAAAVAPKADETSAKPQDAAAAARHPFDAVMEKFRPHFNPRFVEATAGIFRACGSYGLLLAAVLTAAFAAIATAKTAEIAHVLSGVIWLLLLVVLQYVAGRSFAAIGELNRATAGRLASSLVPDATVVLSLVAGVALLLGSIGFAIGTSTYLVILGGVAAFFVCAYLSVIALHPSMLNISIAAETMAGEELIGVLTFALKALLRLTPVAFGAGVVCGTVAMAVACFLASVGGTASPGSLATADVGQRVLVSSAALPLAAYLVFLFCNLVLNLWRAVLSLPGKLDALADSGDEIGRGQPDTVTTHE
ncbi:MAG: DUF4339 domain-containing protein [Thermoguttaceae bacterium]